MSYATASIDERPNADLIGLPPSDSLVAPISATPGTDECGARDEGRLHQLFRHGLRAGQVNPLLHMVPAARRAVSP